MDGPAIDGIRTGMHTRAGRGAPGKTDLRTFELRSSFCSFRAIPAHPEAFLTDGNTIICDCEVIFVNRRTSTLVVKIYKRPDIMVAAVFVVSHGVMCRIEQKLGDMCLR